MRNCVFFLLPLLALSSCFQIYDEDDDLRTVPVTNNPHVVPTHTPTMPGIGMIAPNANPITTPSASDREIASVIQAISSK